MKRSILSRYALFSCAAAAMLTGCSGSQSPIGPVDLASRLRQSAALLYVVSGAGTVEVVNYATGKVQQIITLMPPAGGTGACSDALGDVFITGNGGQTSVVGEIYEYQHGGQTPVTVLNEPYMSPSSCAVDPMSGNLAVTNGVFTNNGNVAVFPQGQNPPTTYTDPAFNSYVAATYDNLGNLYIIGYERYSDSMLMAELPNGGSALENITLNQPILGGTCIQWDGSYLAVTEPSYNTKTSAQVYRVSVSGSAGRVVQTIKFPDTKGTFAGYVSLIIPRRIILTLRRDLQVGIFRYPAGGNILREIRGLGTYRKGGLALSK